MSSFCDAKLFLCVKQCQGPESAENVQVSYYNPSVLNMLQIIGAPVHRLLEVQVRQISIMPKCKIIITAH